MSTSNTAARCCSDLKLDRLLVGDCDDDEAHTLRVHLEQSAPCRARYEALVADRDAFVAAPPALNFTPTISSSMSLSSSSLSSSSANGATRGRRRWSVAAGMSALAASVAVLAMQPSVVPPDAPVVDDVVRRKGGAVAVWIHRKRGDVAQRLQGTDTVTAGDVLRAEVMTASPMEIVVVSVDADGAAAWNTSAVHVDAGRTTLPFAVELSEQGGDLTAFVYACDHVVEVPVVQRAAGAAVPGCTVVTTTLKRGAL